MKFSIEGNPFIIRFKTLQFVILFLVRIPLSIEGNPFIIRFKTVSISKNPVSVVLSIEGNPFIIRFKTLSCVYDLSSFIPVLKVIHL